MQRQEEEEDKWKKKLSTEEDARERQGQPRSKEILRHANRPPEAWMMLCDYLRIIENFIRLP